MIRSQLVLDIHNELISRLNVPELSAWMVGERPRGRQAKRQEFATAL